MQAASYTDECGSVNGQKVCPVCNLVGDVSEVSSRLRGRPLTEHERGVLHLFGAKLVRAVPNLPAELIVRALDLSHIEAVCRVQQEKLDGS